MPPQGEPAAWRDMARVEGQRYWSEIITQETRIRGAWRAEYAPRFSDERAAELAAWNAPPVVRSTADDPPARAHTPHRMGAVRALAPLSAYDRSLRDWHAPPNGEARELLMSRCTMPGDVPRPSRHRAWASEEVLAQLAPPSSRGDSTPGRSSRGDGEAAPQLEKSRSLRRAQTAATLLGEGSSPNTKRLTAEERRQAAFVGAAGKPHPRNFGGTRMPNGFDRPPAAERLSGIYRPTEADMHEH
jgi:hypothetical protein